jgi:type II secretion system protein D
MTLPGQTPVPQDRVDVTNDILSNALIISASKENLALIKGLLEKIDVEPPDVTGVVRMYPLQNSDAQRVQTLLQGLIQQGLYKPGMVAAQGNALLAAREKVSITTDVRTNVLIVSASKENFAVIEEIIKKIDSTEDFGLLGDIRLFTLKNADATRLAPILQQLFTAKRTAETAAGGTGRMLPVSVFADARTNTLLVTGSKESFNAVEAMIRELDTDQILASNEFRVFYLKQATATVIAPTLQQLFAQRVARGGVKEPVTIVTEARTNSLIVSASPDDLKVAESLINRLDAEPDRPGTSVQVFAIAKADATQVATTLRSLYTAQGAAAAGTPSVVVGVDERINAVVVSAGPADLKRIGEIVQQLDTDTVPRVTEIRVFTLQNADATELAAILTGALNNKPTPLTATSPNRQSLLQFITRSKEGTELISSALQEGVLITPDRRTNSLVISAPVENMPLLESLVKSMDSTLPRTAEIRVISLVNADARQMATVLQQLFKMQGTPGVAAAGAAGKQAIQYTLVPNADDGKAPPAAVIGSAEDAALTVTVDVRTNSMLIGGTRHYVELATKVIEELDASTASERLTEVYRLRNAKAQDIQTALTNFLTQERTYVTQALTAGAGAGTMGGAQILLEREVAIVAEPISNTLLLSASPRYFDVIATIIQELDQPPPQVLIQVLLAEVTLNDSTDFGIDWNFTHLFDKNNVRVGTNFGMQAAAAGTGFGVSVTGGDISAFLRALEAQGRVEVLSRPQVLASDNQHAVINVGQRVPFITNSQITQYGSTINTVMYQQVGIILDVTARINPDGFVKLEVKPEVSSLSKSSDVQIVPNVPAVVIDNRTAETTVTVQDGHTIVIGGLITTTDDKTENKVPFFGDIPILGYLFKSTSVKKNRRELLIILTPTVLRNVEEADTLTEGQVKRLNLLGGAEHDRLQQRLFKVLSGGTPGEGDEEAKKVPTVRQGAAKEVGRRGDPKESAAEPDKSKAPPPPKGT